MRLKIPREVRCEAHYHSTVDLLLLMSNGIILKALLNRTLYSKPEFQRPRLSAQSNSSGSPSPPPYSRLTSSVYPISPTIDLSFVLVKLQLPSTIPQVIKSNTP